MRMRITRNPGAAAPAVVASARDAPRRTGPRAMRWPTRPHAPTGLVTDARIESETPRTPRPREQAPRDRELSGVRTTGTAVRATRVFVRTRTEKIGRASV